MGWKMAFSLGFFFCLGVLLDYHAVHSGECERPACSHIDLHALVGFFFITERVS